MFKHLERKSNEVIFRKCPDPRCSYCVENPPKQSPAWNYLAERDFKWPNPVPSTDYPEHYMTFMEIEQIATEMLKSGINTKQIQKSRIQFKEKFQHNQDNFNF